VPRPDPLRTALDEARKHRRTDYVVEYGGFAVGSIKKAFRATAARAGFAPGEVTPYTLRHTAATWMAQVGVPLWEIAGHLGHQDTRMVEKHYATTIRTSASGRSARSAGVWPASASIRTGCARRAGGFGMPALHPNCIPVAGRAPSRPGASL